MHVYALIYYVAIVENVNNFIGIQSVTHRKKTSRIHCCYNLRVCCTNGISYPSSNTTGESWRWPQTSRWVVGARETNICHNRWVDCICGESQNGCIHPFIFHHHIFPLFRNNLAFFCYCTLWRCPAGYLHCVLDCGISRMRAQTPRYPRNNSFFHSRLSYSWCLKKII